MKTTRVVVAVVLLCAAVLGQTQRDPAGVSVLSNAVNLLGGARVGAVEDCSASAQLQSMSPYWQSGAATWEIGGKYLRYRAKYPSGSEDVVIGPRGGRLTSSDGKRHRLHVGSSIGAFVPFMVAPELLRRATDSRFAILAGGSVTVGNVTYIRVRTWLDTDEVDRSVTYQEWFFDAQSGLPARVAYRFAENGDALSTMPVTADFADYQMVSGVAFPFRVTLQLDGDPWQRIVVASIAVNPGIDASEFDASTGGAQ